MEPNASSHGLRALVEHQSTRQYVQLAAHQNTDWLDVPQLDANQMEAGPMDIIRFIVRESTTRRLM